MQPTAKHNPIVEAASLLIMHPDEPILVPTIPALASVSVVVSSKSSEARAFFDMLTAGPYDACLAQEMENL
jgi:hypothetical protein